MEVERLANKPANLRILSWVHFRFFLGEVTACINGGWMVDWWAGQDNFNSVKCPHVLRPKRCDIIHSPYFNLKRQHQWYLQKLTACNGLAVAHYLLIRELDLEDILGVLWWQFTKQYNDWHWQTPSETKSIHVTKTSIDNASRGQFLTRGVLLSTCSLLVECSRPVQ